MENYRKEPGGGKPLPIILDDLLNVIDDHCDFACYYLDRETGEIIFQSERELDRDAGGEECGAGFYPEHGGDRFIPIEPMESHRGYELIRDFIGTLADSPAAKDLSRAISMRKPFRRFKDTLHNYPETEALWRAYSEGKIKKVTEEWLRFYSINYEFVSLKNMLK